MFRVIKPELFEPNCSSLLNPVNYRGRKLVRAIQNRTAIDVVNKIYKPRLTLENRPIVGGRSIKLRVEFSAPKLLFNGSNFDELRDDDFSSLLLALKEKLALMGVIIPVENLRKASISAIHFSKNFVLDDYTSVSMILSELSKANVSMRLTMDEKSYRNGGYCLKFHTNSYEVVFYDKIADLEQGRVSDKRAIENDNASQMDIFEVLDKIKKPFEVLRMEVRLGNRTKIKSLFKSLKIGRELNFECLFDSGLSKSILEHYWNKMDVGVNTMKIDLKSPIDLLEMIKKNHPVYGALKLLQLIGAIALIQEVGVRRFRGAMGFVKHGVDTWYRLRKDLDKINDIKSLDKYLAVSTITKSLSDFIPLRMRDYELELGKM